MRIHPIMTGTVAIKAAQRQPQGEGLKAQLEVLFTKEWTEPLPIFAWLIEHPEGLILVDTGETARTAEPGYWPRWHPYYRNAVRAWVKPEEEVGPQIRALGFSTADVRRVVMTHLHTDHAGGLSHCPQAEFLVTAAEYSQAKGFAGKVRGYLPHQWPAWFKPTLIRWGGDPLGPFPASQSLTTAGDVWLVPTPGHSAGHMSVIVHNSDGSAVFVAGDTSYTQAQMLAGRTDGVSPDPAAARATLARIQRFVGEQPTIYLPSHDPESAARLQERQFVTVK